jgi:hypothetical protein
MGNTIFKRLKILHHVVFFLKINFKLTMIKILHKVLAEVAETYVNVTMSI